MLGPGSEARQAAQRTRSLGSLAGGMGCWHPGGLPQPGSSFQLRAQSRAPGHPGGSGVAAKSSGGDVSMAPEPSKVSERLGWVLCGAGGRRRREPAERRRLSQRACSPPPCLRTGLASLGYRGGWNNGSPMPARGSEGPQTEVLKMGAATASPRRQVPPLLELLNARCAQGTSGGRRASWEPCRGSSKPWASQEL